MSKVSRFMAVALVAQGSLQSPRPRGSTTGDCSLAAVLRRTWFRTSTTLRASKFSGATISPNWRGGSVSTPKPATWIRANSRGTLPVIGAVETKPRGCGDRAWREYMVAPQWELLGRLGYDFGDDDGVMVGIGGGYILNKNLKLRLEYVMRGYRRLAAVQRRLLSLVNAGPGSEPARFFRRKKALGTQCLFFAPARSLGLPCRTRDSRSGDYAQTIRRSSPNPTTTSCTGS